MFAIKSTSRLWLYLLCLIGVSVGLYSCLSSKGTSARVQTPRVLVFSKTAGWKHSSIPSGIAALQKLGLENNIRVDTTINARYFTQDSLQHYQAVVFLSTTLNVLNAQQQVAFERYIQAGGGFVGIHAAADTEYEWPWYNKLVGAYFASHPHNQTATVNVLDKTHPATAGLPDKWQRLDEWYNYKSINPNIKVLAKLDESTYQGGINGDNHPIIWYHEYDGGRSFYSGLGHTEESYVDPVFLGHLLGGLKYAIGNGQALDYRKAYAVQVPEENRFVRTTLVNDLNEPMELAVAADGRVFYGERNGKLSVYNPVTRQASLVRQFPVETKEGFGLLGLTLDPDFRLNNFIYVFYSPDKEKYKHYISRFVVKADNTLDIGSEKVLIQVPVEMEASAHHGGSLAFDKAKNLIIATGDNTVPFQSNGHAPIDEIPGRIIYDAQRSAGNTNDLRGKILRIHPEADGSYTIPAGNLFPPGTAGTRPEIYTMGLRNPYRLAVHPGSGNIYWGEIGPDSGKDSELQGPKGYDEFNQAKKPGNFGWPYFIGNTQPYRDYDFAAKTAAAPFNAAAPVNNSPNNTGLKALPPAQSAMIWYPYEVSPEFPDLGSGGRSAMAGEFYTFNQSAAENKFPAYYNKGLFVFDWMRNWVKVIRLDENEQYQRTEDFLPFTGNFKRPIDLAFGPDGVMYLLEYGSVYGIDNDDARLVKFEFNQGNRAPVAKAAASDSVGVAPFKVAFSSKKTYDFDEEDKVSYQWLFDGQTVGATEPNPTYTYTRNGIYPAILKVTDKTGAVGIDTIMVKVGNSLPQVAITATGNQTFYWDNTPLKYAVKITDKEDDKIDPKKIQVYFDYNEQPAKMEALVGHQLLSTQETNSLGKTLVAGSDCKACHTLDKVSVGPAFTAVAQRYKGDASAVDRLAKKIIQGGGGNWGEHAMSAHPQVSNQDAAEMVKYILSLAQAKKQRPNLPLQGTVSFTEHVGKRQRGQYVLVAAYTDKGGQAVGPLTNSQVVALRPARLSGWEADRLNNIERWGSTLGNAHNGSFLMFKNVDLTGIKALTYRLGTNDRDGQIAVHLGSPRGPVVSTTAFTAADAKNKRLEVTAAVTPTTGKHDLYFVVTKKEGPNDNLVNVNGIQFNQ